MDVYSPNYVTNQLMTYTYRTDKTIDPFFNDQYSLLQKQRLVSFEPGDYRNLINTVTPINKDDYFRTVMNDPTVPNWDPLVIDVPHDFSFLYTAIKYHQKCMIFVGEHELVWEKGFLKASDYLQNAIAYKDKRYLIISVDLVGSSQNHANLVIVDNHIRTIEIYEPNGVDDDTIRVDHRKDQFKVQLTKLIPGCVLIDCNLDGFQVYDDDRHNGLCFSWCCTYAHLRMKYSDNFSVVCKKRGLSTIGKSIDNVIIDSEKFRNIVYNHYLTINGFKKEFINSNTELFRINSMDKVCQYLILRLNKTFEKSSSIKRARIDDIINSDIRSEVMNADDYLLMNSFKLRMKVGVGINGDIWDIKGELGRYGSVKNFGEFSYLYTLSKFSDSTSIYCSKNKIIIDSGTMMGTMGFYNDSINVFIQINYFINGVYDSDGVIKINNKLKTVNFFKPNYFTSIVEDNFFKGMYGDYSFIVSPYNYGGNSLQLCCAYVHNWLVNDNENLTIELIESHVKGIIHFKNTVTKSYFNDYHISNYEICNQLIDDLNG